MAIYISLLVALIGMVAYILAAKPEAKELGKITYFAGLLAFLITGVPKIVELLK